MRAARAIADEQNLPTRELVFECDPGIEQLIMSLPVAQRGENADGRAMRHAEFAAHRRLLERPVILEIDPGTNRGHAVARKAVITV